MCACCWERERERERVREWDSERMWMNKWNDVKGKEWKREGRKYRRKMVRGSEDE